MKPVTLKKLLKPPFTRSGFSIYDKTGRVLELCDIFPAYDNNAELSDQFATFVEEALNEKWERDRKREKIIENEEDVYCSDCRHAVINEQGLEWCKERETSVDFDVHEPCACFEPENE